MDNVSKSHPHWTAFIVFLFYTTVCSMTPYAITGNGLVLIGPYLGPSLHS